MNGITSIAPRHARRHRAHSLLALLLIPTMSCSNIFSGDCVLPGVYGIQTLVTDARTQRAPTSVATVRLRDGEYVETITVPFPGSEPPSYAGAVERPGRYDVTVDAAGYRSETRTNIVVQRGGNCNAIRPVRVPVTLTPVP